MPELISFDDLPHESHSHEFVGADHQDVPFSVILVHSRPGMGPRLHRHPYAEVFIVQEGEALFTVGDSEVSGPAGSVVVVPAGDAHRFQAAGDGTLRMTCIHAAGEMQTEWL